MGNIGFKTISVSGFEGALHGMRAPYQSYHLADSVFKDCYEIDCADCIYCPNDESEVSCGLEGDALYIGKKDMDLAKRLIQGGTEHSKFRRMIHVQVEVAMPRCWWSEGDTYKIGTVANSESTMHKLLNNNNPITEEQFYFGNDEVVANITKLYVQDKISQLELLRQQYKDLKPTDLSKNQLLVIAKRILPECFIQVRTWDLNYETIANIYKQRVKTPHRLKEEWIDTFGKWVETLPFSKELIIGD